MEIFELINNYIHSNVNTYGELLLEDKDDILENSLSPEEKQIYKELKAKDKNRLLMQENKNMIDIAQPTYYRQTNVSGIGDVVQIC